MSLDIYPDEQMLETTSMKIVDIRTEPEWQQTGIVEGSHCITFFDMMGNYDVEKFLAEIEKLGGKEAEIGLICRTGSRTAQVAHFMAQQGYNVKNLAGGITKLIAEGYMPTRYQG